MENQVITIQKGDISNILKRRYPNISSTVLFQLEPVVKEIIDETRKGGDNSLVELTRKFDGIDIPINNIEVTKEEIEKAYDLINGEIINDFNIIKQKIVEYEEFVLERNNFTFTRADLTISCKTTPLETVGCYIPGGRIPYPSTVFMTVVPALVAGVKNIVLITPPKADGIDPNVLVAADMCGVSTIYKAGGAQAIAALAYGTETVKKVDLIAGPGNIYVTIAKKIVSQDVLIDNPAGPSEILIYADRERNTDFIVSDLIAQAEHGPNGAIILVTTSEDLAKTVQRKLKIAVSNSKISDAIKETILSGGAIVVLNTVDECINFINKFAPEHLEIFSKDFEQISSRITNSGLILDGEYSPAAASDYCFGTNHIIPTSGYAKVYSSFSSLHCVKRINTVKASKKELKDIAESIFRLTDIEKLENHKDSIRRRI